MAYKIYSIAAGSTKQRKVSRLNNGLSFWIQTMAGVLILPTHKARKPWGMRITDPISESGYFWLPSTPDHKVPGRITISNGGKVEIETIGHLSNSASQLEQMLSLNTQGEERIHGHINQFGDITVDHCTYTKQILSTLGGTSLSAINAYLGALIPDGAPPLFESIDFSFDGLNEWARQAALSQVRSEDRSEISITYKKPKNIDLNIGEGVYLHIIYDYFYSGSPETRTLKSIIYLRLTFEEPQNIEEAIIFLHRIQNFFSFAMDKTIHLLDIIGRHEKYKTGNAKQFNPIRIFYHGVYDPGEEPPKIHVPEMLFYLELVKETLEENITRWLRYYEVITPTLNLYFSQKSGGYRFLNGRFLALAQAVETLHRNTSEEKFMNEGEFKKIRRKVIKDCPEEFKCRLGPILIHGNELSLKERLERIMAPYSIKFGGEENVEKLIRLIKDNRNYLTHYDRKIESKLLDGQKLYDVCLKIEAILQIKFMEIIGFNDTLIDKIVERSHTLANKLRFALDHD